MTKVAATIALALLGLAPALGAACEYRNDSSASATPTVRSGMAPAPAATRVPTPAIAKPAAPAVADQAAVKVKTPVPDQRLAAGTAD